MTNFIRTNPMSDKLETLGFHHVEFYTFDATSTASYFINCLGLDIVSKTNLSTGNKAHYSIMAQTGDFKVLITAPGNGPISEGDAEPKSDCLPNFSENQANQFLMKHGLAVRTIAWETPDVFAAFKTMKENSARVVYEPTKVVDKDGLGYVDFAEVEAYGDVNIRLVNTTNFRGQFLPNFKDEHDTKRSYGRFGVKRLDHIVGNVWDMNVTADYIRKMTGFHDFAEFTAEDVGTVNSGLNSVVLANNNEMILMPINEPTFNTKRQSQIETYLIQHRGEGVQHMALITPNIFHTLKAMRAAPGGMSFMPAQDHGYYERARVRIGLGADGLTEEQFRLTEEYGVLIDKDDRGILLQIFTKPFGDRPTAFIEIIQRVGCGGESGSTEQKAGCGGFGKGNFKDLFKSIEDYEETLHLSAPSKTSSA